MQSLNVPVAMIMDTHKTEPSMVAEQEERIGVFLRGRFK
jgi:hypothetical protein